jgi:hypothetical protein
MTDIVEDMEALCRAMRKGDPDEVDVLRREFVAHNWGMISALDKLADAQFSRGEYELATRKLELITELMPNSNGFFLRRLYAAIRAGTPGALEELAASAARIPGDTELFTAIEELIGSDNPQLATNLIDACRGKPAFSPAMLATAQSRILYKTGRTGDAIALLKPVLETEKPPLPTMRSAYLLMEEMLDFAEANRIGARTVLAWGEERDLRHVHDRLLYLFRFSPAERLLEYYANQFRDRPALVAELLEKTAAAKAMAQSALDAYGPVDAADPAAIHEALSSSDTPAPRVLWAKQALVALLYSGRMTEADYATFAWFLPNWEEGLIRDHVLAAARQTIPQAIAVRRGWLRYLIRQSIYADAARHCLSLIQEDADEDTLFFAIMLLRLNTDGITPVFMDPEVSEALRVALLARAPSTEAGFRCVMHDHIVALGSTQYTWPDEAVPPVSTRDSAAFRRLFAITTGRLACVSALPRKARSTPPTRPIIALSGQLRGFETAWPTIHKHLCVPLGVPVVMTVWDKSVNAVGRHAQRLERALPADIVEALRPEDRYTDVFERRYPETFKLLFGQTDVKAADLANLVQGFDCEFVALETESERLIERLMPKHVSANMLKMYYKFARLEALIRALEVEDGALFSHVVWSRPDCEIVRLSPADLNACLARADLVWSSFTNENTFGDYVMILPRRAFSAIAGIFGRVVTAGDTALLPWRPNRSDNPAQRSHVAAFGGPDVLFDTLLAQGYVPLNRIPRIELRLVGRTPGAEIVRRVFQTESDAAIVA